jgi:hypothetical protein
LRINANRASRCVGIVTGSVTDAILFYLALNLQPIVDHLPTKSLNLCPLLFN